MPHRPTMRKGPFPGTTTYRRRLGGKGGRRALPSPAGCQAARTRGISARGRAALACLGAAILMLAGAIALPSLTSLPATADISLEARSEAEASQLQGDSGLPRNAALDVPALQQYPELPTGCESVALTNALLSCGFDLQKTEIAQTWLPTSDDDFVYAFLGDPFAPDGHSCMAPGIERAAEAYLTAQGAGIEAADLTGATMREVLGQVAAGNPVIAWCTIDLDEPEACYRTAQAGGRTYRLVANSHCVVVRGYDLDAGVVLVSDSLVGQASYPLGTFAARYYALGAQAVVLQHASSGVAAG